MYIYTIKNLTPSIHLGWKVIVKGVIGKFGV